MEKEPIVLKRTVETRSKGNDRVLKLLHIMRRIGYSMAIVIVALGLIGCSGNEQAVGGNVELTRKMEITNSQQDVLYRCGVSTRGVNVLSRPAADASILRRGVNLLMLDPFFVTTGSGIYLGATIDKEFNNGVVFVYNDNNVNVQGDCIPAKAQIDSVSANGIILANVSINGDLMGLEPVARGQLLGEGNK